MARKTYSEEFRRDAVELYRSTPGATVVGIAADLGVMDATLSEGKRVLIDDPGRFDGVQIGSRNLNNYIAKSRLETGGFRPRLHPKS